MNAKNNNVEKKKKSRKKGVLISKALIAAKDHELIGGKLKFFSLYYVIWPPLAVNFRKNEEGPVTYASVSIILSTKHFFIGVGWR